MDEMTSLSTVRTRRTRSEREIDAGARLRAPVTDAEETLWTIARMACDGVQNYSVCVSGGVELGAAQDLARWWRGWRWVAERFRERRGRTPRS